MPVLYCTWASLRAADMRNSMDTILSKEVWGGRPGRCCADVQWPLALMAEESGLFETNAVGAQLDWSKCFDRILLEISDPLLRAVGVPSGVANALEAMDRDIQKRFRAGRWFGPIINHTNGSTQGCALSGVKCNVLIIILVLRLRKKALIFTVNTYLDDVGMHATESGIQGN